MEIHYLYLALLSLPMNEDFGTRAKRTGKKVLRAFLLAIIIIGAGVFAYLYWGVFEDGVMAGKVLRVSKKGYIFKTWEGKINLETFGALKGASPIAESFDFSIEKDREDLIKRLEEVSLTGERVNLYFVKRHARFPWRGDTRYFVVRVERLEKKQQE